MELVDKPAGITMNQLVNHYKKLRDVKKMCYTGRLDPMAKGKVLLLKEDACKKMPDYLSKDKVYKFEIILGIQTDTDDPLGIIENINFDYDKDKITNNIILSMGSYIGEFTQKFHNYSSRVISGNPLWYYTKNKIKVSKYPTHTVKINYLKLIDMRDDFDFSLWRNNIIKNISTIDTKCDFRQEEIIKQWEDIELEYLDSIVIEASVSSGFYIRQFVRDLSYDIDFPLMVYDINRTDILI